MLVKYKFSSKYNKKDNDEKNVEIDVRIKEDLLFDKRDIIEESNSHYSDYNQFGNITEELIENSTLEELILKMKQLVKSKNSDFNLWYKLISKFNYYLCSHQVSKQDIIKFLEVMNFFQPKVLEKKTIDKDLTKVGSTINFSKRHEEEYFRILQPPNILMQFALFLKKNITANAVKEMIKETGKYDYKEDIDEGLEDLLGIYDVLFKNIELKIVDDIRNGRASYNYSECVNLIASFSRASEGTNLLYELLMKKVAKHVYDLTIKEIEIIINYLPHDLYDNQDNNIFSASHKEIYSQSDNKPEQSPEQGRTSEISEFYSVVFEKIIKEIPSMEDKTFLNFFQGCLKVKFVDLNLLSAFLNNFDLRITKQEKNKTFYFEFLQILAYFLKIESQQHFINKLNLEILYKAIEEPFIKKYLNSFDLKEIATIFWVFYHFQILSTEKIKLFDKYITSILTAYINDPKAKIDTMGYETQRRYYDDYSIEPYDLQAIYFFVSSIQNYKGELIDLMKKTLKCMEVENTHPISRKWFYF